MLCNDILWIASLLVHGDCGPYWQQRAARKLENIADEIKRLEELADGIVASAQDEAVLASAQNEAHLVQPLHHFPARLRVVR